jgi:hypothetical protein
MTNETVTTIFCCGCQKDVEARLTDGKEIYAHRPDLYSLPFWKCDTCKNFVGCHHKTAQRTKPLGNIPTPELKKARQHIHRILDPLWQNKIIPRGKIYAHIAHSLGLKEYHTGELTSVETAREVYKIVRDMKPESEMCHAG